MRCADATGGLQYCEEYIMPTTRLRDRVESMTIYMLQTSAL